MKVFQILGGFCHWDATETLGKSENAAGRFPDDVIFVDAPDFVREGWGYDASADGDERFIRPEVPEGWLYDDMTGTFYPEGGINPSELAKTPAQLAQENMELRQKNADLEEAVTSLELALCDVYEAMISANGGEK